MTVGIIGGTGASFDFADLTVQSVQTRYGSAEVELGQSSGGVEIAVLSRHGKSHGRLSSHIDHRANIAALQKVGVSSIIATTVCGVVDPSLETGRTILFDDLLFLDNRLPDGTPCSMFDTPGEPGRGHYIFDRPFSSSIRSALSESAESAGIDLYSTGVYGYMLGPRFNTKAEIALLSSAGVSMVSQTAAPEAILAGELEIPYALIGFGTDYANGIGATPTPVEELEANIVRARAEFSRIIEGALPLMKSVALDSGFVYRFD